MCLSPTCPAPKAPCTCWVLAFWRRSRWCRSPANVPLSVAVLSYADQLNIGIQSDPDSLPNLDLFTDGLRRSLEELGAAISPLTG